MNPISSSHKRKKREATRPCSVGTGLQGCVASAGLCRAYRGRCFGLCPSIKFVSVGLEALFVLPPVLVHLHVYLEIDALLEEFLKGFAGF